MLATRARCAFRRHFVSGSIVISVMFTILSIVLLVALSAKIYHNPYDIIEWIIMLAAIPLIRVEVDHYMLITKHLRRKAISRLGNNQIYIRHLRYGEQYEGSRLSRERHKSIKRRL